MQHPTVYALSKKYGPPRVDLRRAQIADDYGHYIGASRHILHRVPDDVSGDDLRFYPNVFNYMDFTDLLFYLYPVALEFEKDKESNSIGWFLYAMDRHIPQESEKLPREDRHLLIEGLRWIWAAAPLGIADWEQCPNLQRLIGVSIPSDEDADHR